MTTGEATRTAPARLFGNAYLLLALAGLCWSGNHILGRAIAGQVPPFAVACGRYFLAALVLYPFARALWENEEMVKRRNAATPLRRIGMPDEIGGVAAFLAGPAASFITGQVIVADGGVTIS